MITFARGRLIRRGICATTLLGVLVAGCAQPVTDVGAAPTGARSVTSITGSNDSSASAAAATESCRLPTPPVEKHENGEPNLSDADLDYSSLEFWPAHGVGTIIANEPRETGTLSDRVHAADLAVRGRITKAEVGIPMAEDPWGAETRDPVSLITITATDGKEYRFGLLRTFSPDCVLDKPLPTDEYVFLLAATPTSSLPDTTNASCKNTSCVVAVLPDGGAYPLRKADPKDPQNWWPDTTDIRGMDDLWQYIEKQAGG